MKQYCYYDYIIDFEQQIGQGQFGIVVECHHKTKYKNIQLCAKMSKQQYAYLDKQMYKELLILKKIQQVNNSHLVKVFDMFEEENKFFIIMERCTGGDLKNLIETKKKKGQLFKTSEIIDFIYQFIDGYQVLYDNNIIHRDIKPSNIYVDHNQTYKIGDLGSGRILEDANKKGDYTKIGSPFYCSPQIIKLCEFSSQSDVYSFGILIFQLTFFDYPFKPVLSELQQFIADLQQKKFSLINFPIKNTGSQSEKNEIQFLIENMLVYDENQRISWKSLFQRIQKEGVYQQFRPQNYDESLISRTIDWEKNKLKRCQKQSNELKSVTKLFQKQNQNKNELFKMVPKIGFERKRSPLSVYLTSQLCKVIIADQALSYLCEAANSQFISIYVIDYYLISSAIYGYQWNLLKNIEAIQNGDYNSLSEHILQQKNNEMQNIQAIQEFQQCKSEEDIMIIKFCTQQLSNLPKPNKIVEQTIKKINEQKIRLQILCEMRDILLQFTTYVNYYKYWQFICEFFQLYLQRQFMRYLQSDLSKLPDSLLFCMVYIYELYEIEEKYKQLELFKDKKILIMPQKFYTQEDALNYLNNMKNEQTKSINQQHQRN